MRVGIVGVGWFGFQPGIINFSSQRMIFRAAQRAYQDAGG